MWYVKCNFWTHFWLLSPCAHMYICYYRWSPFCFFFSFCSRPPFTSPFFSDLKSTWTDPISSPPVPSPLFVSVFCGKKYTTAVTLTPWCTGAGAFPLLQMAGHGGVFFRGEVVVAKSASLLWRRLHGARGTRAFPLLQIAGQWGTVSRRTANKKLAKLYWPSQSAHQND